MSEKCVKQVVPTLLEGFLSMARRPPNKSLLIDSNPRLALTGYSLDWGLDIKNQLVNMDVSTLHRIVEARPRQKENVRLG